MKKPTEGRIRRLLGILCLAVAAMAAAQVRTADKIKIKAPKIKTEKLTGEVVTWQPVAITIRDHNNNTRVRTFSFTPALQRQVENRYMENGDKVTVYVQKGTDLAVKLRGKIRRYEALPRRR